MPLAPASKGKPRHNLNTQVQILTDRPAMHLVSAREGSQACGNTGKQSFLMTSYKQAHQSPGCPGDRTSLARRDSHRGTGSTPGDGGQ